MVKKPFRYLYLGLILLFLYAPIVVMIIFSFNSSKSTSRWTGFSLKWYAQIFSDRQLLEALYYTFIIATISALISTVVGTMTAWGMYNSHSPVKKIISKLNDIPILNPDLVTGISLMLLFSFMNIPRGFLTLLLAHIIFCTPFVILTIMPLLRQLPKDSIEAAMDLGATPSYAFRKVIFPQIKSGIVTGMLIAFTLSVDDVVISYFNSGTISNLSMFIFSSARRGISPRINALSTLMFAIVLLLLLIIDLRTAKKTKETTNEKQKIS